jgi:hypothetical protein
MAADGGYEESDYEADGPEDTLDTKEDDSVVYDEAGGIVFRIKAARTAGKIPILLDRLFNLSANTSEILADIDNPGPQLSMNDPQIQVFVAESRQYVLSQEDNLTKLLVKVENPNTWPTLVSDVNDFWL